MNVYEFIKKAYGTGDLSHLGLYLATEVGAYTYKVDSLSEEAIQVLYSGGYFHMINSSTAFRVVRTSLEVKLSGSRILLTIVRSPKSIPK